MTTLRSAAIGLSVCALAASCTARDFFGLRDDAPLHAIERPGDFPTTTFGMEIAPTRFQGADGTADFAAISGGRATPTAFFRLSSNGDLVDVDEAWDYYLMDDADAAKDAGSGAALAGLPAWASSASGTTTLLSGCTAIGEPKIDSVHIYCPVTGEDIDIPGSAAGAGGADEFGKSLAPIRPAGVANWLLAVAAERFVVVFGSAAAGDRSDPAYPTAGGGAVGPISEIAAGLLPDGRFFVAAATADEGTGASPRVHLFAEDAPHSRSLAQVACVDRAGEPGFGGSMIAGDLDGDGADELIASAGDADGRLDAVHVYDPAALEIAAPTCSGDAPAPIATVAPGAALYDVSCPSGGCDFGAALAVGDLATDDGGAELIVGAPGAKVDGVKGAGAVYIYRGAELVSGGAAEVASCVADSSPEKGQRFGGGVAAAPMAGRVELLAGAVGQGKTFIAYCTGVGSDIELGADVPHNARGKIVSTRCRPR